MSPTPIFQGSVDHGKLLLDEKSRFLEYLYSLDGRRVQVTVSTELHRRSGNQNRYYWGVCLKLLADFTGAEPEEVHIAVKMQFSPKRFIGNLVAPATTKKMDIIAFENYLDKVRRWAQEELNVKIPLPNEVEV